MAAISDGSSEAQDKLQEKIYKSLQPLYANIVSELYRNFFSLIGYLEGEGLKKAITGMDVSKLMLAKDGRCFGIVCQSRWV